MRKEKTFSSACNCCGGSNRRDNDLRGKKSRAEKREKKWSISYDAVVSSHNCMLRRYIRDRHTYIAPNTSRELISKRLLFAVRSRVLRSMTYDCEINVSRWFAGRQSRSFSERNRVRGVLLNVYFPSNKLNSRIIFLLAWGFSSASLKNYLKMCITHNSFEYKKRDK